MCTVELGTEPRLGIPFIRFSVTLPIDGAVFYFRLSLSSVASEDATDTSLIMSSSTDCSYFNHSAAWDVIALQHISKGNLISR